MTFELRTYVAVPGRMPDLLERFERHTIGLFDGHGMRSIGYWHPVDDRNVLVYLLQHEGDPAANWDAFRSDERWQAAREESTRDGELTSRITSQLLEASPLHALSQLGAGDDR